MLCYVASSKYTLPVSLIFLSLYNTSICCMVGHLTAGQNQTAARLKDIVDIQNNSKFSGGKSLSFAVD